MDMKPNLLDGTCGTTIHEGKEWHPAIRVGGYIYYSLDIYPNEDAAFTAAMAWMEDFQATINAKFNALNLIRLE